MRRVAGWTAAVVMLAAAAGAVRFATASPAAADPQGTGRKPDATAELEIRDLRETTELSGRLGFSEERDLQAARSGTLTRLAPEGAIVRRGGRLYDIDGVATRLLYGKTPAYREFRSGMSEGADVAQLERNLVAMGFDPYGAIEVDGEFDSATAAAIERWEEELGVVEDGVLSAGEVFFAPGELRIGAHDARPGNGVGPGAPLATVSSTRRVVEVDLDVSERELVERGAPVTVRLPGGRTVRGRIAAIGRVVREPSEPGGSPTVQLVVALRDAPGFDKAPVEVGVETVRARDALAAPVTALLALAEGGFALEVVDGRTTELVAVETGAFADGWVEVRGEGLDAGTEVVVAP